MGRTMRRQTGAASRQCKVLAVEVGQWPHYFPNLEVFEMQEASPCIAQGIENPLFANFLNHILLLKKTFSDTILQINETTWYFV